MNAKRQAAGEIAQAREHLEAALALLRENNRGSEQYLRYMTYNLCAEIEKLEAAIKEVA